MTFKERLDITEAFGKREVVTFTEKMVMDAKKKGWKNFELDYEWEMNYQISQGKDEYKDNKYEIEAEDFGQKNYKKWYKIFKKEGLF